MSNQKSRRSGRRRRKIRNTLWLLTLLLVFLIFGCLIYWIVTMDEVQLKTVLGIEMTPTPTPTPTSTPTPTPTPTNTPTPTPIAGRIIIDAGHGGSDAGTTYNGYNEKDIALDIALLLRERLIAKDYDVIMTRENDDLSGPYDKDGNNRINPNERAELLNTFDADLTISIHLNSFATNTDVSGLEILYGDNNVYSKDLAETLLTPVISYTGANNRGAKHRDDLVILRDTKIPTVIIETGFITNAKEVENLQEFIYKDKLVRGIVEGIDTFMKLH